MIAISITSGGMKKIASGPKCGKLGEKPEDHSRYSRKSIRPTITIARTSFFMRACSRR